MEDREHPNNDEYSFMQEVIKDEENSGRRLRVRILHIIGYGVIFGVAASVVFSVLNPWINQRFRDENQIEIPRDEDEADNNSEGNADSKEGKSSEDKGNSEDAKNSGEKADSEDTEESENKVDPEDKTESEDKAESEKENEKESESKEIDSDGYRRVLQSLSTTATKAKRSMVVVSRIQDDGEQGVELIEEASGLIVANNGTELLILSQTLKTKKGESIQAAFPDGNSYSATLKMQDVNLGISVYAVERDSINEDTWSGIRKADLGNSNVVENGDSVIVIGKPFGTDEAFGYGIVTADEEYVEKADGRFRLLCTNIAGGDGSGIILNREGFVIGIIDPSVLSEGSSGRVGGYAISDIKDIIELLSNGSTIPYTGIYGMDVTEELEKKGMPQGIYVREVAPDSPAMAAGIQSGDVLVNIDGEDIINLDNYHRILMHESEGNTIELRGCRQGAEDEYVDIDFTVTVSTKNK